MMIVERRISTNLDRVVIEYERKYQMVIVPKDQNNPLDNLDANYQRSEVREDAIEDSSKNSKGKSNPFSDTKR